MVNIHRTYFWFDLWFSSSLHNEMFKQINQFFFSNKCIFSFPELRLNKLMTDLIVKLKKNTPNVKKFYFQNYFKLIVFDFTLEVQMD